MTRVAIRLEMLSWALDMAGVDTREVRPPNSRAFAILNDRERPVSTSVEEALRQYEISPVPWSKREESLEVLAA